MRRKSFSSPKLLNQDFPATSARLPRPRSCLYSEEHSSATPRHRCNGESGKAQPRQLGHRLSEPPYGLSSSKIVPVARATLMSELLLWRNRSTKKVSFDSLVRSPKITIAMVLVVSPGAKVTLPLFAW